MTRLAAAEIEALDPYKFWLMPRMAKAVPYLGSILISGTRPNDSV
jgi:hypothetical protein